MAQTIVGMLTGLWGGPITRFQIVDSSGATPVSIQFLWPRHDGNFFSTIYNAENMCIDDYYLVSYTTKKTKYKTIYIADSVVPAPIPQKPLPCIRSCSALVYNAQTNQVLLGKKKGSDAVVGLQFDFADAMKQLQNSQNVDNLWPQLMAYFKTCLPIYFKVMTIGELQKLANFTNELDYWFVMWLEYVSKFGKPVNTKEIQGLYKQAVEFIHMFVALPEFNEVTSAVRPPITVSSTTTTTTTICDNQLLYSLPKGKVEQGKTLLDQAIAELKQETSVVVTSAMCKGNPFTMPENASTYAKLDCTNRPVLTQVFVFEIDNQLAQTAHVKSYEQFATVQWCKWSDAKQKLMPWQVAELEKALAKCAPQVLQ